jgi:hypothetical protein
MNEAEQFVLFARQHGWPLLLPCGAILKQSENKVTVLAVFCKPAAQLIGQTIRQFACG